MPAILILLLVLVAMLIWALFPIHVQWVGPLTGPRWTAYTRRLLEWGVEYGWTVEDLHRRDRLSAGIDNYQRQHWPEDFRVPLSGKEQEMVDRIVEGIIRRTQPEAVEYMDADPYRGWPG